MGSMGIASIAGAVAGRVARQQELTETEIEAVAADGGATVVISGAQVPLSVEVTDELLAKGADAVSEAGATPRRPAKPRRARAHPLSQQLMCLPAFFHVAQ